MFGGAGVPDGVASVRRPVWVSERRGGPSRTRPTVAVGPQARRRAVINTIPRITGSERDRLAGFVAVADVEGIQAAVEETRRTFDAVRRDQGER